MIKIIQTLIISLLISSAMAKNTNSNNKIEQNIIGNPFNKTCLSTREYITTLRFLRDKKDYQLSEKEMQKIADKVSTGCTGASKRFIKVHKLLSKLGVETRSSIENSLKFIDKKDDFIKVFIAIFRLTYDKEYLDLDVFSAMKISLKLSAEYEGDVKKSLEDFKDLIKFCMKNGSMELPSPKCATLATDVTYMGQYYKKPVAEPFIELFLFIQEAKNGPTLHKNLAIKTAKQIIKYGPLAVKNFKEAYLFATDKEGLGFSSHQAVKFATQLASRSIKEKEPELKPIQ